MIHDGRCVLTYIDIATTADYNLLPRQQIILMLCSTSSLHCYTYHHVDIEEYDGMDAPYNLTTNMLKAYLTAQPSLSAFVIRKTHIVG